jgi:putative peptidoglycan lipid II flippase
VSEDEDTSAPADADPHPDGTDAGAHAGDAASHEGGAGSGSDAEAASAEPARRAAATPVGVGMEPAGGLRRATTVMAVATTLSRITGVLRIAALFYAVGASGLADSYNLANTLPNIVHDVVLGGVLAATFVPVFVERLATRRADEATEAISAVVTATMVLIAVASVAFLLAVPLVVDATTGLSHGTQAAQGRAVARDLLYMFAPQLTCYGFISLGTALLNARRRFGAPMYASIANNVVMVAVLVAFGATVHHAGLAEVAAHRNQLLLLGLGTTAGVVAQAALMVPSLRRAGLRLRWHLDFRHEAVARILRLSGWTFGLVMANQVALVVVLALSERIGPGAVSAYTYAWTFFQLPYGVVAVSIMSATAPELTARWATGDLVAFRRRMGTGLRTMLAIIIPAAAGLVVLARPAVALVGGYGAAGGAGATQSTAVALAMLALGLPGFCVFLYAVRVLQAVQDLRSAFWLYALENGINIVLAVVLAGPFGVRGIALSISAAYTVAALVALGYVRARVQGLGGDVVGRPLGHVVLSTAALVVAAALGSDVSGSEAHVVLVGRVALGTVAGLVAYVAAAGALAEHAYRRRRDDLAERRGDGGSSNGDRRTGTRPWPGGGPPPRGPDGAAERHRRGGAPPRPEPMPPAGRPPLRPTRLGPTRQVRPPGSSPQGPGV